MFKPYRGALIKFRLCVSNLDCHRFKFNVDVLETKLCSICRSHKETELHFIFACPSLEQLRQELLPQKYLRRRNLHTLIILMSSETDRYVLAK